MRKLSVPTLGLVDVYQKCVATITSAELRERLSGIQEALLKGEAQYRSLARTTQLYRLREAEWVGEVSSVELSKLYSQTFVRDNGPTRDLYELLRKAPSGICPLCGQRVISTLDHYLSKARHPAYAVTPMNLVPACKDCNTDSRQKRPVSAGEQTLHPYFDDVDGEIWLAAEISQDASPAVMFKPQPVKGWGSVKNSMISSHFEVYRLGALYASHSGSELVNLYMDLQEAGLLGKVEQTRSHLLEEERKRRRLFKNSWQAALYAGLARSDWFCTVGIHDVQRHELFPPER